MIDIKNARLNGRITRSLAALFASMFLLAACGERQARHYMDGPCPDISEAERANPNFDSSECRIVNE